MNASIGRDSNPHTFLLLSNHAIPSKGSVRMSAWLTFSPPIDAHTNISIK
jgi:hypothetical protein